MSNGVQMFQVDSVNKNELTPLQRRLYETIFEANTLEGRIFDLALLVAIVFSVIVIMLESVESIVLKHGALLKSIEWFMTILFTIEYILRIYCVGKPRRYVFSFFGIVDLLAIIPTYLTFFITIGPGLNTIRILRFIRIYNVLKLSRYTDSGETIMSALYASRHKIIVFLTSIFTLVIFVGGLVYFVESTHENSKFPNIPASIYWAIVTITTVGYGDITPVTPLGQFLSAILMISGYAILAVPTGIVTGEMVKRNMENAKVLRPENQVCRNCQFAQNQPGANFCPKCGTQLSTETTEDLDHTPTESDL